MSYLWPRSATFPDMLSFRNSVCTQTPQVNGVTVLIPLVVLFHLLLLQLIKTVNETALI